MAMIPHVSPTRATMLCKLGFKLFTQFDKFKAIEDLNNTIFALKDLVTVTPLSHADPANSMACFGSTLSAKLRLVGDQEDLD